MSAVGIIAEYNPFHNGHEWHVRQAKKLSQCHGAIAVMSGHFLQRGEPASFNKWLRAKMAVLGGVDLVIELPSAFAVRSAQYFAEGGVRLLASLGIVSHVCFGAEYDCIDSLRLAAAATNDKKTTEQGIANMKQGHTYARSLSQSISKATGIEQSILSSPNNILAIEYLRAIDKFAPEITPIVIKRQASNYHDSDINSTFASATAIRKALEEYGALNELLCSTMPASSVKLLATALAQGLGPVRFESLAAPLLYLLRTLPPGEFEQITGISEGLHYKVCASALKAGSIRELLNHLKSKRYTLTRLQRMLIHILLDTRKPDIELWNNIGPQYARVLAFNEHGRDMLKAIGRQTAFPVITKTASVLNTKKLNGTALTPLEKMLALDVKASDIYALATPSSSCRFGGWDFIHSPEYIPLHPLTCEYQQ